MNSKLYNPKYIKLIEYLLLTWAFILIIVSTNPNVIIISNISYWIIPFMVVYGIYLINYLIIKYIIKEILEAIKWNTKNINGLKE